MTLERIKSLITEFLIETLVHERNGFEKREYFIVSRLLWAIQHYPSFTIPLTRVGVLIDSGDYCEEYVIRLDEDLLWVGMDGIERTPCGSDSYENEYLNLSNDKVFKQLQEYSEIEIKYDIEDWLLHTKQFLSDSYCRITIECYDPEE